MIIVQYLQINEYFAKKMTLFHSFDDISKQITLFDFQSKIFKLEEAEL